MSNPTNPIPDWYPDPTGRFEQRYWDGTQWTEHVSSAGQQRTDLLPGSAPPDAAASDLPGLGDVGAAAATPAAVEPPPGWPTGPTAATTSEQAATPEPEPAPAPEPAPVVETPVAAAVTQPAATDGPAPDWYPDPTGRFEQRYWDGTQWTEHASTSGVPAVDPLPDEGAAAATEAATDAPGGATPDAEPNPFASAAPAATDPAAAEPTDVVPTIDDEPVAAEDPDDDADEDPPTDPGPPPGGGPGPAPDPAPTPAPAAAGPAADWYPDPTGRQELRYWDGGQWTEHASSGGRQVVDPVDQITQGAHIPIGDHDAAKVQKQVQQQAGAVGTIAGGGSLFTEPILVVNQKWKLIEVNNEYAVYDQNGNQIGAVRQVGQSAAKKAIRVLTSFDQFMTHSLQVVDMSGAVQLTMTRPAKLVKSKVEVGDGKGQPVGTVIQQNAIGKIRFSLESDGHTYGSINAENWRAWNFNIQDHDGTEVARITKTWEGLAKTMFTTADNYVLQIHRPLEEPLRSLVVASALCVDTALKQDSRGIG